MRAFRKPLRLFAFGVVGLILIVASIDVMFGHWISTEPENTDGVLTTRGQAQQRGDIIWGGAMFGIGTLLVGGSVIELVRRRPQVVVASDAITLAIGPRDTDVVIPWDAITEVGSTVDVDPYDGSHRRLLVLTIPDPSGLPSELVGADWHGDDLRVDANEWTRRVTDVALSAQGALGHHRRVEELKQMGPPSVEWEEPAPEGAPVPAAVTGESSEVSDEVGEGGDEGEGAS